MKAAVCNAAAGVTLRTLPHVPDRVKRLLLGHRSITVDGNTLDTTLQLLRAVQRAAGGGVVSTDDVVAARTRLDALAAGMKRHPGGRGDQYLDTGTCRCHSGPALSARRTCG